MRRFGRRSGHLGGATASPDRASARKARNSGRGAAKNSPGLCRSARRSFDVGVRGPRGGLAEEENAMPRYMLIMRGTDESNAALLAGFEELAAACRRPRT